MIMQAYHLVTVVTYTLAGTDSEATYYADDQNVVKAEKSLTPMVMRLAFHTDLRIPRHYRDTVQQSGRYSNIDPYL